MLYNRPLLVNNKTTDKTNESKWKDNPVIKINNICASIETNGKVKISKPYGSDKRFKSKTYNHHLQQNNRGNYPIK